MPACCHRLKDSHLAPTVVSYTTAMRGLGLSRELAYAERLFRTMLDDPNVRLDLPAWNVVIDTFCRTGAMPLAKKVFQAMKTAGVRPDLATYGSLVLGFSRREDIGEVLVLWKEIRERNAAARESDVPVRRGGHRGAREVGTSARGEIIVDQRLCDEVLSACIRAGYYERALSVVAVMEVRSAFCL
jgi:pentatricopeptide repeat protein